MATSIQGANGVIYTTTNSQTQMTVQTAFASATTQYDPNGGTVAGTFVADNVAPRTYVGTGNSVTGFLPDANYTTPAGMQVGNQSVPDAPAVYETGTASVSTIYASDLSGATLINNNATGTLNGIFGAGGGAAMGLGLGNNFGDDPGAHVNVQFESNVAAQSNTFSSFGQDTVGVTGSLTNSGNTHVMVYGSGSDTVTLAAGGGLTFVNNSTGTSLINGSDGSTDVGIGGRGATSVVAGAGTEGFNVDTASGNVTLTGSTGVNAGPDTFAFTAANAGEIASGTAKETVNNFTANDSVLLKNYGTSSSAYSISTVTGAGGSTNTVVTLSDHTSVTFTNASASTVQNAIKLS